MQMRHVQEQIGESVDMEEVRRTVSAALADDQRRKVHDLLQLYEDVFSSGAFKGTQASVTKHQIKLYDDTPIFQRSTVSGSSD